MKTNVYNIIWADDEVDALKDHYEERFNDNEINIIGWAHDGKELEERLSELSHIVDAVIVDANFNFSKTTNSEKLSERIVSGLEYAHALYVHRLKRSIPFFLFTQRTDELLHEKLDEKPEFFEDFKRHKNWFKKNDDDELLELFNSIKEAVEYKKTDSFRIRNKYALEFEAAKNIEDAERNLEKGLLFLYEDNSWKDMQDYFNPARKIVERIKDKCIEMKILPPKTSLNNASRYFSGKDTFVGLKEEYMPKPLAESFFFFLKITQDGSHDENDMSLGVDKYVRNNKNINLYRSILYIAMDLLLWFDGIQKKYKGNKEPLWEDKYIDEGKVCTGFNNGKKFLYTKKYEIQPNKDLPLKDGDIVRIYKSENLPFPKGHVSCIVKRDFYRKISD